MRGVTIYTGPNCPFCDKAKEILEEQDISFTEYEATSDKGRKLFELIGATTVPQIFFKEIHIGGCSELDNLNQTGLLTSLLSKDNT